MNITRQSLVTRRIESLDELHALIDRHGAWGQSLDEFKRAHGRAVEDATEILTDFQWGGDGTLRDKWDLVQHLHTHYQPK